jgi:uncharacterized DUF497 family protein
METSVEWDPQKALSNFKKHGVSFTEAVASLEDDLALTLEDEHPAETRFISLGRNDSGRILVVVYTYRAERIRIISARPATERERKAYEQQG